MRSNLLSFLCNLHATNKKNDKGMQPIEEMQIISEKWRLNMDHRFIPNTKSSNVFIRKTKFHCKWYEWTYKGAQENLFLEARVIRSQKDQDQRKRNRCLHSAIKDCNLSGSLYLILSSNCIRMKILWW